MDNTPVFYDIYDYYYQPFQQTLTFKFLIIFGLVLLGALLGYLFFRRRYRKKLSAWQWALQEIAKLSPEQCTGKKELKKFYYNLTEIIKNYLNKRYGWNIMDQTDIELVAFLQKENFDKGLLEHLEKMFEGAEWVKFANQDVIKTQAQADLKIAQLIIEKTMPLEKEAKN